MALAGGAYAVASMAPAALWLVVVALALNWFGDSLDGTLARVRRVERPRYGFYVDHVLDIVGISLLLGGLACSGYMTPLVAMVLLVTYLLVTAEVFLATAAHGVFRMSFLWMGPTELRIVLAVGTLALFRDPQVDLGVLGRHPLFDVGGVAAAAGLVAALISSTIRNTRVLARLEPRR
jgi:phosphatidylglycerophosphate synthase